MESAFSGGVHLRTLTTLPELDAIRCAWDRLVTLTPSASPMHSYAWLRPYFEHRLGPGERWICVVAEEDDYLAGILPLVVRRGHLGALSTRLRPPCDSHTISVGPAVAPWVPPVVQMALIERAVEQTAALEYMEFPRLREDHPLVELLRSQPTGEWHEVATDRANALLLRADDSYEAYLARLGKNWRTTLRKRRNKLKRMDNASFEFLRGAEAKPEHLDEFLAVEASGWKGREGSALAHSPELVAFYRDVCTELSRAGWLEWQFLRIDGRAVAAHMCVRIGARVMMWKIGFDEEFAKLSPGALLFDEHLRRCYEDGATRRIDLMTDQPWHENWRAEPTTCVDIEIFPSSALGLMFGRLPQAARDNVSLRWLARNGRALLRRRARR